MGPFRMIGMSFDTVGDGLSLLRANMKRALTQSDGEDELVWDSMFKEFKERGFTEAQSLRAVNAARAKRGLKPLKASDLQ